MGTHMSEYTPTIGLEVHAELNTKTKMFCGCKNAPHESEVNANTCPVCLAHPGTLPVANESAVAKVLRFGHAVDGEVATYSEFDRKNYFYPDIPKAYQISQYAFPFVKGGKLAGVELTRVHLEEDTARSQHDKGEGSVVDFNRAGVPLMELVTEPVIHDAKTAGDFARELQLLLRSLGISEANMERGEMRVEANISVSKTDTLGTKVEVKNLNSFKVVEQAIECEIKRHIAELEAGNAIVQETRGWDEAKGRTFSQRTKETAEDYRYFPDPDLPKVSVSDYEAFDKSRIAEKSDNLPSNKRKKYENLGLSSNHVETILYSKVLSEYFEFVLQNTDDKKLVLLCANYLVNDFQSLISTATEDAKLLSPEYFLALMTLTAEEKVSSRGAKDILAIVALDNQDPLKVAEEQNLLQSFNKDDILPVVEQVIAENPTVVEEYKAGKEASLKYLVGQGMKLSKGSANPKLLTELLQEKIS